jgi:hypothetical protein
MSTLLNFCRHAAPDHAGRTLEEVWSERAQGEVEWVNYFWD